MAYTLGQASKATGKTKAAISQAIAANRISAAKDELGRWQIDPAELHRVYPIKSSQVDDSEHQPIKNQTVEIERLKATVDGLERLCRQIEGERDSLRERLDLEGEERRKLTAILTDQRDRPIITPPPAATKPRRWWQRRESA